MSKRIYLDPGHGGKDPGATGNGMQEKQVVLDIGLRLRQYLLANFICQVKMTREVDIYVSHAERCAVANKFKADLFLSIHTNSSGNPSAGGFETYVYRGLSGTARARVYQKTIHQTIMEYLKGKTRDRGMKDAGFYVLKHTAMPAILAEYLFINNPNEAKLLADPHFREGLAIATSEGVAQALGLKRKKEESDMEEVAIVYHSGDDEPAARRLATQLNCGLFPRAVAEKRIVGKKIIIVGGGRGKVKGVSFTDLSGDNYFMTAKAVEKYIRSL